MSNVEVRAERLRVLLALHQGGDTLGAEGCKEAFLVGLGPTAPEDLDLMDEISPDDDALAFACFAIEADLRQRGWEALERLASLLPVPNLNAAVIELPPRERAELVEAALILGWRGEPPKPG